MDYGKKQSCTFLERPDSSSFWNGQRFWNLCHMRTSAVCVFHCSVVSDALRPHGLWPARLLCPQDSPGKILGWVAMTGAAGALPDSAIEPRSPTATALQPDSLLRSHRGRCHPMACSPPEIQFPSATVELAPFTRLAFPMPSSPPRNLCSGH